MDQLAPALPPPKRRQSYSLAFKSMVVKACEQPGNSVASVAQQYSLNVNLVHKWRRQSREEAVSDFVRLPAADPVVQPVDTTVRIELPGPIIVHWPIDHVDEALAWVKALMP